MPIPQISHTEHDPAYPVDIEKMGETYLQRLFHESPAVTELPLEKQLVVIRQILRAQEFAASRRHAYYSRYIQALGITSMVDSRSSHRNGGYNPADIPADSLATFTRTVAIQGETANDHDFTDGTKGVSAELGYVPQFGDWKIDTDLTRAIEGLPTDIRILQEGIMFDRVYDRLHPSDIRYKIKIFDGDKSGVLPGVSVARVRPVADLSMQTKKGDDINLQLVKRSTFSVTVNEDRAHDVKVLEDRLYAKGDTEQSADIAIGETFVERAIDHYRHGIYVSDTFPAESLYFVIMRKRSVI